MKTKNTKMFAILYSLVSLKAGIIYNMLWPKYNRIHVI